MISNEVHLNSMKGELAKRREILAELEAARTRLPSSLSPRVGTLRAATIRQEIRELEVEIQQYEAAKRVAGKQLVRARPDYLSQEQDFLTIEGN